MPILRLRLDIRSAGKTSTINLIKIINWMQLFVLSLLQSHESGGFLSWSMLNIDAMLSNAMLSTLVAIQ